MSNDEAARIPETTNSPDNPTWIEQMLATGKPLNSRHKRFAALVARGATTAQIQAELGYASSTVSILKSNSRIREEVDRIENAAFERTVGERVKELGGVAMYLIEQALLSNEMRLRDRVEVAKWLVEKIDGKAGQKVDVQHSTLDKFMSLLLESQELGTLDITPRIVLEENHVSENGEAESVAGSSTSAAEPQLTDWSKWLDEH